MAPKRPREQESLTLQLLDSGATCDPRDLLYKKPTGDDRKSEALVTVSAVTKPGHWKHTSSFSRAEMAREVAVAYETIRYRGRAPPVMRALCVREPHSGRAGEYHYHLVLSTEDKTNAWAKLAEALRMRRIAADVRVCTVGRFGLRKLLAYVMIPNESKPVVDRTPFTSNGFPLDSAIIEERQSALKKLSSRPATNDDLFEFTKRNPQIATPDELRDLADTMAEEFMKRPPGEYVGEATQYMRLAKFFSKNAERAWAAIAADCIERRDRALHRDDMGKPFSHFFLKALMHKPCACHVKFWFYHSMVNGLLFHQDAAAGWLAPGKTPLEVYGQWVEHLYRDDFPDRRVGLLIFGTKGTGKTTLGSVPLMLYPSWFVGTPCWEDTWPLGTLDDRHLWLSLNDFRITEHLNRTVVLNLLERKAGLQLAVKGEKAKKKLPNIRRMRWVLSANYLSPACGWREEDLDALEDRAFGRVVLKAPLPERNNVSYSDCARCAALFMVWTTKYTPGKHVYSSYKSHLPNDPTKHTTLAEAARQPSTAGTAKEDDLWSQPATPEWVGRAADNHPAGDSQHSFDGLGR